MTSAARFSADAKGVVETVKEEQREEFEQWLIATYHDWQKSRAQSGLGLMFAEYLLARQAYQMEEN